VLDVQVIDTASRRLARVGEVDLDWDEESCGSSRWMSAGARSYGGWVCGGLPDARRAMRSIGRGFT